MPSRPQRQSPTSALEVDPSLVSLLFNVLDTDLDSKVHCIDIQTFVSEHFIALDDEEIRDMIEDATQYRTSGVRFAHSKAKDPYLLLGDLKLALRVRKKLVMFDAGYKQADDGSIPWVGVVRPYREKWVALLTAANGGRAPFLPMIQQSLTKHKQAARLRRVRKGEIVSNYERDEQQLWKKNRVGSTANKVTVKKHKLAQSKVESLLTEQEREMRARLYDLIIMGIVDDPLVTKQNQLKTSTFKDQEAFHVTLRSQEHTLAQCVAGQRETHQFMHTRRPERNAALAELTGGTVRVEGAGDRAFRGYGGKKPRKLQVRTARFRTQVSKAAAKQSMRPSAPNTARGSRPTTDKSGKHAKQPAFRLNWHVANNQDERKRAYRWQSDVVTDRGKAVRTDSMFRARDPSRWDVATMGPRNKAVEALIESIKIAPTTPFVVAPRVSQLAELPSALDYELYETKEYKRAIANGMKKSPSNDLRAFAFSRAQPAWKAWQSNIDGSGHDFVDALNRPGDGKPPHNPSSSAAATASALRPRAPHSRRDTAKQLSATARGRRKLVGLEGDVMQPSPSDFDDLQHTASNYRRARAEDKPMRHHIAQHPQDFRTHFVRLGAKHRESMGQIPTAAVGAQ